MNIQKNIAALLTLILIAGCSTTTDHASPVISPATDASFSSAMVVTAEDTQGYRPEGTEVVDAMNKAGMAIGELVEQYREGEISAEKLSKGASKIVSEYSENPILETLMPQLVSHAALEALLKSEVTTGLEPYIAEHTRVLVENNSPQAGEISRALEVLDGYWAQGETAAIAKKAVDNAEHYLGLSTAHAADKAAEDGHETGSVPMEHLRDNRSKVKEDIGSGIENLQTILDR